MPNKFNLSTWAVNTEDVLYGPAFTVASLPSLVAGGVIYVSDGAAGNPVLAFCDGSNWLRSDTLAAVSDS